MLMVNFKGLSAFWGSKVSCNYLSLLRIPEQWKIIASTHSSEKHKTNYFSEKDYVLIHLLFLILTKFVSAYVSAHILSYFRHIMKDLMPLVCWFYPINYNTICGIIICKFISKFPNAELICSSAVWKNLTDNNSNSSNYHPTGLISCISIAFKSIIKKIIIKKIILSISLPTYLWSFLTFSGFCETFAVVLDI